MSLVSHFVLPSDYGCIALVNPETYAGFVGEYWQLEQLIDHIVSEVNQHHIVAWGSVHGNWKIVIHNCLSNNSGYQEILGTIDSNKNLLLANYESLTHIAQFADEQLPLKGMENFIIKMNPGRYRCRIIQLFDPNEAESEKVFFQTQPHFRIELEEDETPVETWTQIPWFP
ncbi:hypothetical protein BV378_08455 [Nostoc sp. RF31YmG]|jgi:hypothetical protein|nr:hypothetical protein BV378_08455 [Nostoc sp. RF31YmG]